MKQEELEILKDDYQIRIEQRQGSHSSCIILEISILREGRMIGSTSIKVKGTGYLYLLENNKEGGTVKIDNDNLFISHGDSLYAITVPELKVNWIFCPDQFELYEFYELENDLLIRGELAIYRIDKSGNVIWRYGGKDIFVSIDGEMEVKIMDNYILLSDFNSEKYKITYDGEALGIYGKSS